MEPEKKSLCPECGNPLPAGGEHHLCLACLMAQALASRTASEGGKSCGATPLVPPAEIQAKFPHLEVTECLGRGGMGVVYKARQRSLDRWVAVKILPPERVGEQKFADRFAREAAVLAKLSHPNIVTVHDFGEVDGLFYIIMEYVDGVNLRDLLREGKLEPEQALSVVPPICEALCYAHEKGIVHRDIKPENVLLDRAGRVKVADFGIAKILGVNGVDSADETGVPDNATQSVVGTPAYSAPEQKSDPQRVDNRADIYSLGVVFYEMLTGELPGKPLEPPSRKVRIDVRLDEIVLRALERKPELRYQQASVLKTQVETIAAEMGGASVADAATRVAPDSSPAGSAAVRLDPSAAALGLTKRRWEIVIWGFILAAACVEIGLNVTPVECGWIIGIVGVLLFLMSVSLTVLAGIDVGRLKIAAQIVLLDGIVVAFIGIWCAFHSPGLPDPWAIAISIGCGGGILYCLNGLIKVGRLESQTTDPLGYIAFFFAIISGIIPTIFYWLKPWAAPWLSPAGQQFMLWLTLLAGIAAVMLGFVARKLRFGWQATVIGGLNVVIWLLFFVAGRMSPLEAGSLDTPELLQDETLEIQRDGSIACQLKSSSINRTGHSLDSEQFNASSFLQIQKITDDQGSPLKFDVETGRGDLRRYRVRLEPPVPPMGSVTYVSEGTMVGLIHAKGEPGVFEYSMDHSPGYDGITRHIERHKLPTGAQLVWKNTTDLEEEKVGDIVELHIDRRIPSHGHIAVRYRYKLGPAPGTESTTSK